MGLRSSSKRVTLLVGVLGKVLTLHEDTNNKDFGKQFECCTYLY